jgi:hypothetical protein
MGQAAPPTYRCGVCLIGFDGPAYEALCYLVTHLNELQHSLEFELVDVDSTDDLVELLLDEKAAAPAAGPIEHFADRQDARNLALEQKHGLLPKNPDSYVVVSLALLEDHHHLWRHGRTSVLALGGWNRSLAPPSLVEVMMTHIVQVAGAAATAARPHLGTRGCLFDFNPGLRTARYKVLNSFICRACRDSMSEKQEEDLRELLGKYWLGQATNPIAPAGICRKLGYDLYLTKGVRPTFREAAAAQLQGSWVGELLKVAGIVLAAALVLVLGMKGAG